MEHFWLAQMFWKWMKNKNETKWIGRMKNGKCGLEEWRMGICGLGE